MMTKRPKVVNDFRGQTYVQEREHHGKLTMVRNYRVEY